MVWKTIEVFPDLTDPSPGETGRPRQSGDDPRVRVWRSCFRWVPQKAGKVKKFLFRYNPLFWSVILKSSCFTSYNRPFPSLPALPFLCFHEMKIYYRISGVLSSFFKVISRRGKPCATRPARARGLSLRAGCRQQTQDVQTGTMIPIDEFFRNTALVHEA